MPAPPQLAVDLARDTGPVHHGASGALYGLSEDGVPGLDLLAPLHVRTIGQKPPGGLQHPTGGADKVAPEFAAAGGQQILVYMQDCYSDWPYQNVGISDYLTEVAAIIAALKASPYHRYFSYVPFNEPDWIWYTLDPARSDFAAQLAAFEQDWATVCRRIRAGDPGALIAGPNSAVYDPAVMSSFFTYAKANGVLPDIATWHELNPSSILEYRSHYASYRALEKQLGIGPMPININEYGNRRDLSNPGQLVQWMAMFEDTKVDADLAFWDIAGNYSDNAVGNNQPNGSWWLLRWYGAMTGHTAAVTPPAPAVVDTLAGLASLDPGQRQARIIVANPAGGDAAVAVSGLSLATFGDRVHVSVQSTTWTGYDGVASTPLAVAETGYHVANGQITVPLGAMDPMAAYQVIISPAIGPQPAAVTRPWIGRYLAADATLTDVIVRPLGSLADPNGYAAAGGADVGPLDQPGSRVRFHIPVPSAGRYLLSVYYGNQTEHIGQQIMQLDDQPWSFISYPPTLNWGFRSHQDLYLQLTAGPHTITFGTCDPSIGAAEGQVTLNGITLACAPGQTAGVTGPATHYPAAFADLSGNATVGYGRPGAAGPGYVRAPAGAVVCFVVAASHDGYHGVRLRCAGDGRPGRARFRLLISGAYLKDSASLPLKGTSSPSPGGWSQTADRVWLHAGINPIAYQAEGPGEALIDALDVTADLAADALAAVTYPAAAPQNMLSGTAAVQSSQHAYDGQYVGGIGNGAANTLTFTGIHAAQAGTYRVTLSYASSARASSGNYNVNLIDRGFTIATSAGTNETRYARNTYSWDQFAAIELTVALAAGSNTITFGNPTAYAPNIDKIIVAPAYLP